MPSPRAAPEQLRDALASIPDAGRLEPRAAIVLGSGLGALADRMDVRATYAFRDIPGMSAPSVPGHGGRFVLGRLGGVDVIVQQGRLHLYEGSDAATVVSGVRLMRELGASVLLVTNAAGGIDPDFRVGDLMLIDDHLNLTGENPLVGAEWSASRFVDMSEAYDAELKDIARRAAAEHGIVLREGVYAGLLGPSYETRAEIRMLRTLGAAAVGMSTVLEVIAARHRGMRCVGLSCITNQAAGTGAAAVDHDEVQRVAAAQQGALSALVESIVGAVAEPGA